MRRRLGFPYAPPSWPGGIPRPPARRRLGVDYDTSWARRPPSRLARAVVLETLTRPLVRLVASPTVLGADRLEAVAAPAIFAANHHSHLDTPLLLSALPPRFRHRTAVAAGADYFFDRHWKAALSALAIAAVPIDRTKVSRRSADLVAELVEDGWNLVIFPEGGRSPDGWARPFRGGAAYLGVRCRRPVVPVYLEGTRRVLAKGSRRPSPATTTVAFGRPLRAESGDDARRLAARIEREVTVLAHEQATDWWTARRYAAACATPPLTGPEVSPWRRAWALGGSDRSAEDSSWP